MTSKFLLALLPLLLMVAFMGLTAATMFPGLDGICRMMKHAMSFKTQALPPSGRPVGTQEDPHEGEELGNRALDSTRSDVESTGLPPAPPLGN